MARASCINCQHCEISGGGHSLVMGYSAPRVQCHAGHYAFDFEGGETEQVRRVMTVAQWCGDRKPRPPVRVLRAEEIEALRKAVQEDR